MLYLATRGDQPLQRSTHLSVEEVEPTREAVRRWLTLPVVRYIGSSTGCSCAFRHVVCDEPFDYYEGMYEPEEPDDDHRRSREEMLALVRAHAEAHGEVELLPVWDGEEGEPPHGTIELTADQLDPHTFFFIDRFLYRVTRAPG